MEIQSSLTEFLDHLRSEKGLSPNTLEAYGRDVASFGVFLQNEGKASFREATSDSIYAFLSQLKAKDYASSSISRMLIAIKVLFRFLKKEQAITQDITRNLETPKIWQLIPEALSKEEVEELLAQPKSADAAGA